MSKKCLYKTMNFTNANGKMPPSTVSASVADTVNNLNRVNNKTTIKNKKFKI